MLFLLLAFNTAAFGEAAPIGSLNAQRIISEKANVRLVGYRFLKADGTPNTGKFILLPHGLHANLHEFEHLVRRMMAQGYDCYAFNFRGHGNGDDMSRVLEYHDGAYSFDKMAEVDFPAFLEAIRGFTDQRGFIVGHSMGGMVPRASIKLGLVDPHQIEAMVLIGSPPHFRRSSILLKSKTVENAAKKVFIGSGNEPFSILDTFHDVEKDLDFLNFANPIYHFVKAGLTFQMGMLKDFARLAGIYDNRWMSRAMTSTIPKDVMRSFAKFQEHYPYEDVELDMPVLYIIGEQDVLVHKDDVIESARKQSRSGYWLVSLPGVGHISLVAPDALKTYGETLDKFLEAPSSIGIANETHHRQTPSFCSQALLGL